MALFKATKREIQPKLIETPEQKKLSGLISGYAGRYGEGLPAPGAPYPGRLSADIPETYGQIDPLLRQYTGAGPTKLSGLAGAELEKTLTGEYDPYTSPYYQSLRRGLDIEKEQGITGIRQAAQKAGMFGSLGRLIEEARLTGRDVGAAGDILAGLSETERGRRLSAVPYAQEAGRYEEAAPVRKLSAIAGYGGIPAGYEQAGLEREYGEFQRQKEGERYPLSLAQQYLTSYQPTYMYPQYATEPSGLSQALAYGQDVADIIGAARGGGGGGGSLARVQAGTYEDLKRRGLASTPPASYGAGYRP